MQLEASANIFIHDVSNVYCIMFSGSDLMIHCQPPVLLEDISTKGLSPDILVAGDIISKKYDFMMGDLDNNPYKIAQVRLIQYTVSAITCPIRPRSSASLR